MTSTRTFILGSLVAASLALTAAGCGGDEPVLGQDTDELTAAQCTFFAVGDRVQICHRTGSARNPYTIIRTSSAGCASGHSGHAGDYVTSTDPASDLYDPTCSGQGCFPIGAPYDGSVGCCEYLAPDGGVCADVDECATDNGGCDAGYACSNNVGAPPTCTEIDECAAGTDDCADHATCANTPGSFTCTCDAGYEGDGVTCTPICGNGHRDPGEDCDDGNAVDGDYCPASCAYPRDGACAYVPVRGDVDAASSEAACQDHFPGGHLASIHSAAENAFVGTLVDTMLGLGQTARIGGAAAFCGGPGAAYAWTDGTPWDFSAWRLTTGEPNCSGGGGPASIQLWPASNGFFAGWNDTPVGDSLGNFVCKFCGPSCGDGLVNQPTEVCDRGALNGVPGSGCRADCTLEPQVQLGLRIHEHCDQGSTYVEFTQDTPNINWPGHLNRPSFVTLGAHTGVIVYSGLNFTGQQRTFTVDTNFCGLTYPNGEGINDNVLSIQMFYIP